jgi:hypothetical protein
VRQLPITTWTYRDKPEHERHIGPMAQDFHELFGVGINETTLSGVDRSGVALAAIQGLHAENQELRTEKDAEVEMLRKKNAELEVRLERMEAMLAEFTKN